MADILDTRDLYGRLKSGVNKGLKIVNIRSKEAYGTILIKNRLRSLKKKRRDSALDMGNTIYRSYKYKGEINQDSIMAKCAEIENIEREMDKCEEELRLVHLSAQKALGSLKALAKPAVIAICECGAEVTQGLEFCSECSKKVDSPEAIEK
jgi:hypothetical protein